MHLLIDSFDNGRSGMLCASRSTTPASRRSEIRRLSFSSVVFTAVTRGMSKVDRRSSPTCGSRWLSRRHLMSAIVLGRHSSMLSSSQLEANSRKVGSSWPIRRSCGRFQVPARTASRRSSSATSARPGVQPSRSVPKRSRSRRPSTVMRT